SARIGVIAGGGSEEQLAAADRYADALGLAFQVQDDLLDRISTTEEFGKPVGSDARAGKNTFAALLGEERCRWIVKVKTDEAKAALNGIFDNESFFIWLADYLSVRKK
ncbi:MAG: polyprenyl synthetase family protein, partial [Oscillospiraceae bacterium]|nr:polyprenyl synthetase family protein [Oscillospiraceae bacterium]